MCIKVASLVFCVLEAWLQAPPWSKLRWLHFTGAEADTDKGTVNLLKLRSADHNGLWKQI